MPRPRSFSRAHMPSADDIRDAAAENADAGIQTTSNQLGTVTAQDPLKQLDVADRLDRATAAAMPHRGIRFTRLVLPGRS